MSEKKERGEKNITANSDGVPLGRHSSLKRKIPSLKRNTPDQVEPNI